MPSGYAILAWKILLTNSSTGSRERALLQIDEANAKMRRYKIKLAARVILRIGRSRLRVGQTLGLRTEKTRDPVRGAAPMIVFETSKHHEFGPIQSFGRTATNICRSEIVVDFGLSQSLGGLSRAP